MNTRIQEEFFRTVAGCEPMIHRVCRMYCPTADERKDLFQEIILQLWKAFPSFRGESKASTWLHRIALNTAITYRRREKRHASVDIELPEQPIENSHENPQAEMLYEAISRLGQMDKALIILHLEGYSYEEISSMSGITVTNVATKLSRIKKKIAAEIKTDKTTYNP
jgi:RNA polymerase sigma factor (sigma-70 family)